MSSQPLLDVEGLSREFGSLVAVDDVDLQVPRGELHSIIGPNGAGKTTFFNMIAGTLAPTRGSVRFRSEDVTDAPEHERARKGIVRVFQMAQLFPDLTVLENLRLAAQATEQDFNPLAATNDEHARRARNMFDQLAIDAATDSEVSALSHGDKKKLEIGMGLVSEPDLLLLDEPTSGVAAAESQGLMEFIREAGEDLTILLIEHDIDIVLELSDRVTVLDRGSVIARGTPAEITEDERVQDAYMGGY